MSVHRDCDYRAGSRLFYAGNLLGIVHGCQKESVLEILIARKCKAL